MTKGLMVLYSWMDDIGVLESMHAAAIDEG